MDYSILSALLSAKGAKFLGTIVHADANDVCVEFPIHHECSAATAPEQDLGLSECLPQFADFYRQVNQLWLYCQDDLNNQAFFVGGPEDWSQLSDEFFAWIDQLSDEEREDFLPEWVNRESVLVFAEKPGASTYFLTPRSGPQQGEVFRFDHDGYELELFTQDLQQFLDRLCTPDTSLLDDLVGSFRLYVPGGTGQYIARAYVAGSAPDAA